MFIDLANTRLATPTNPSIGWQNIFSRFVAIFRSGRRLLPITDLSDHQLADLNLGQLDVEPIDPRQVRIF